MANLQTLHRMRSLRTKLLKSGATLDNSPILCGSSFLLDPSGQAIRTTQTMMPSELSLRRLALMATHMS